MYAPDVVIASALVALVLIFIRISWTLKDIHEAIVSGETAAAPARVEAVKPVAVSEHKAGPEEAVLDETEIAAVIAVAHAALRAAV